MNTYKKLAVAAAVSAALGGTATVNALTLGEPGGALLVPYAKCDTTMGINTMVGIVNAGQVGIKGMIMTSVGPNNPANTVITGANFNTQMPGMGAATSTKTETIHWFFYDERSNKKGSGQIKVTKDDFHGFDWCAEAAKHPNIMDGDEGYLVFAHDVAYRGPANASGLNLFGDACVLQGTWGSCAWLPVVPLRDMGDSAAPNRIPTILDEVVYNTPTGAPNVAPMNAGIVLGDDAGNVDPAWVDMRYFLGDLGLGGNAETDMVFWFDRNHDNTAKAPLYTAINVDVFNEDEEWCDSTIPLPDELNVLDARTELGCAETWGGGFAVVRLPEDEGQNQTSGAPGDGAGDQAVGTMVGFSLVWFGPSPTDGVQTVLAHERGLF
jgi:hypothetical protein